MEGIIQNDLKDMEKNLNSPNFSSKKETTYVGIDVGSESIYISEQPNECISDYKQAKKNVKVIANSTEAIVAWLNSQQEEHHYVFESTGVYSQRLEFTLSDLGQKFSKVNGYQVKNYARSLGRRNKTDVGDAISIREFAIQKKPELSIPLDEERAIKDSYRQAINDIDKRLQSLYNQQHMSTFQVVQVVEIIEYREEEIAILTEKKAAFQKKLHETESQPTVETKKLLETIVGVGKATSTIMLSEFGDFSRYQTSKQLISAVGLNPVTELSGKTVRKKFGISKNGSGRARSTIYMAARSAIRYNEECKKKYQELRAKGKPYKVALIAIAGKLVRTMFAVVKSGKEFDPKHSLNVKFSH